MKHDAQGFLLGERINAPTSNASPAIAVLGAVRRDVSVIRRILESRVGRPGVQSTSGRRQDAAVSRAASAAVSATVRRAVSESVARASTSRGQAVTPMLRDARGRFIRAAGVRTPGATPSAGSVAVAVPAGAVRSAGGRLATADGRSVADSERDARGRFAGGGGGGSDYAGESVIGKIASSLDGISDAVTGAENIDPTISALKEVRDAVSPVGRGFMALHNRLAERKKERWYSRILKAITGRKGESVAGGGGDVGRGSFFGTMLGELGGKLLGELGGKLLGSLGGAAGSALGFLGGILSRVFLPVAAAWGAWELGQWIGGKVYEWLDKSGILTKAFDAFDSMGKWFREKVADPIKSNVVKPLADAMGRAQQDVAQRNDARVSTGMMSRWGRAKNDLSGASRMAGVDPGIVAKIAAFESGFNPHAKAPTSSAHGYGQFIDSTWVSTVRKYGSKYGVSGADRMSKEQLLALRGDTKLQAGMLAELTRENVELGRKLGGSDDDANVYALHNLGTGDGSRFLKALASNPGAPVSSVLGGKVISNNKSLYADGSISVADAYRRMGSKMAAGNLFAAELGAARSPSIGVASIPATASASMPAVKPPTVPMTAPEKPAVVQAPPVPESLSRAQRNPVVVISKDDVNQDVRDRRLANIVTGGIGG